MKTAILPFGAADDPDSTGTAGPYRVLTNWPAITPAGEQAGILFDGEPSGTLSLYERTGPPHPRPSAAHRRSARESVPGYRAAYACESARAVRVTAPSVVQTLGNMRKAAALLHDPRRSPSSARQPSS